MAVDPAKKPAYKRGMIKKVGKEKAVRKRASTYVPCKVKAIREQLGMRREEMALALGVDYYTVRAWERSGYVPRWGLIGIQRLVDDSERQAS